MKKILAIAFILAILCAAALAEPAEENADVAGDWYFLFAFSLKDGQVTLEETSEGMSYVLDDAGGGQMVTVSHPEEGPETTDISAVSWKREDQGIQLTDAPRPRLCRGRVQTINKPNYYTIP